MAKGAIVATLISCGCGPIEYLNQVGSKAASAVSAAKLAEADRYAPYEYTAAEEYLRKAREEAGYAQYQDSIEFGRKAEELAHRARAIALNRLSPPTRSKPPSKPASAASEFGASPASTLRTAPPEGEDEPRAGAPRKRSESE